MSNDISQITTRLSAGLDEIAGTIQDLKRRLLSSEKLTSPPRNFLWGLFEDFDIETQSIRVRIGPGTMFYPLSYYDGEWLPMPGQAVIVAQTRRGAPQRALFQARPSHRLRDGLRAPRIVGFTRNGIAIPSAPVVQCRVEEYAPDENLIMVRNARGVTWQLNLPSRFPDIYDADLGHGQVLALRVIDAPPRKYFVPLVLDRLENLDQVAHGDLYA